MDPAKIQRLYQSSPYTQLFIYHFSWISIVYMELSKTASIFRLNKRQESNWLTTTKQTPNVLKSLCVNKFTACKLFSFL